MSTPAETAFYENNTPALQGMLDVLEKSAATPTCEIRGNGLDATSSDDMQIQIYGISPYDTERWVALWAMPTFIQETVPYEVALSTVATTSLHGKLDMFVRANTADRLFADDAPIIPENELAEEIRKSEEAAVPRSFLTRRYEVKLGDGKDLEIRFSKIIGEAAIAREVVVELAEGETTESLRITELSERVSAAAGDTKQAYRAKHIVDRTFDSLLSGLEGIAMMSGYDMLQLDIVQYWQMLISTNPDTYDGNNPGVEQDIAVHKEEMLSRITNEKDRAELLRLLTSLEELRETEVTFGQMFPDAYLPSDDNLQRFMAYINKVSSWK